jgi:hypothetical protein
VHEKAFLMDSYNFMTPVDENRTRYYWFQLRNFDADDEGVSRQFAKTKVHRGHVVGLKTESRCHFHNVWQLVFFLPFTVGTSFAPWPNTAIAIR